ncbi:TPA: hypothetical protein ACGW13_001700 [Stenotrophomonas maltophilia]|uniref:hypothetical protein n=1 Tax=Stenotrophomonas maltophilia TaxID=40324 RepID=UPI0002B8C560|nr:Hypothetical protein EPM1_3733 [Stenotrophomonas maltophilia EPM1]KUJ05018.1 hypothetical protein AR275_16925 [Stenotrophomonas maltophilia]KWV54497.1 hypothetical protein AS591_05780 [Stenotrophomonas maltophilia]KYK42914.1 hypothetical protein AYX08_01215 [Stenotrophomonas maltophilia]
MVEFQPSAWDRGSYLNVGACWLWEEKDYLSFDVGGRVAGFERFTETAEFASAAQALAEQAAAEVLALRDRFPTPGHVRALMNRHPKPGIREHIHAGITAGLAGAYDEGRRHLALAATETHPAPWVDVLKQRCAELMPLLQRDGGFEAEIAATVTRTRRALGLPEWRSSSLIPPG